ncbi:hypothetical protein IMX26_05425 [Clostridium sp. 'deep sea']|uniref:hypothetical protein n=1 Tax=Clostridium sp. 'deep sea' TaxID=2779445 RepID=UPI0018964307|nr:hypothetical protein [Clostridium sp. 'deep sea']QOR36254.1 hypothetical protein IMX26_05425 [Clostridium sp. 'deep sea']
MIVRLFAQVWNLLRNKSVKFTTKLIYLLLVGTYTLAPDLLPFLPFDDLVVIWIGSKIFVNIANKEAGVKKNNNIFDIFKNRKKYDIDAEGEFVDEDEKNK